MYIGGCSEFLVMKFGVKNEWMSYCEWDIKYPTTETNKEIEVLTVAHHKKILDFIKQNFTFVSVSAMLVYTRQKKYRSSFYS